MIFDDVQALASFTDGPAGVTRLAWTPAAAAASAWLAKAFRAAGLETVVDEAGNVFGRWQVGTGKPLLVGSHLDSVPCGGMFDGALGVLAALGAVRVLRRKQVVLQRPLWIVGFMDEEGARFDTPMFGSKAFAGEAVAHLGERRDVSGASLVDAMRGAGFELDEAHRAGRIDEVGEYLELHIEQGPVLERAGVSIGVVTAICGTIGFRVRLEGQAAHAGTTPMEARRDALMGAIRAMERLRTEAVRSGHRITFGTIGVEPGGRNVVPGVCTFSIDARGSVGRDLDHLDRMVRDTLTAVAAADRLSLEVLQTHRHEPLELDAALRATIAAAAEREGIPAIELASGAGHDAMIIGRHVPAAMIFVRSQGGVSHVPSEFTSPGDCDRGLRVLATTIELWDRR